MKKGYIILGAMLLSIGTFAQSIFINEIHYDNAGGDVNEGVEIAGPAGTDLSGYKILLYNGNGGAAYDSLTLSGTIPNQDNGYGTINFLIASIQNGSPDGLAFVDPAYSVIQFLSYEGAITATNGAANGMTSTDIGVAETSSTPIDESLQLIGIGTVYTDFTWTTQTQTRDQVNLNQSFGSTLNPVVTLRHSNVTVNEGDGTVTTYVMITNVNANATSVDVVLGTSTATNTADFTFTSPTTVTFPANDTNSIAVVIPIIDDATIESSEDIVLELQNATNSANISGNTTETITITDNDTPIDPSVSFRHSSLTLGEGDGNAVVYVQISDVNANATSVDVVLGTSTATNGSDFTFTSPTTITFPANDTNSIMVTIPITDDAIQESPEDFVLELQNPTNNATVVGNTTETITINDNDAPIIPACTEPFFSEYIEGSSNNKALEIFNPTNNIINLADYEVRLYSNGASTPSQTYSVSYNLIPGDVYVLANGNADAGILFDTDATASVCNFNGDDAIELYNLVTGEVVDVIGEVGTDPGTSWSVSTGATKDFTLIRKAGITAGTTVWLGIGDTTWNVMPKDDSLDLGMHTSNTCATSVALTAYPVISADSVCFGDTIVFTSNSFGGTAPYTVTWDFGGGNIITGDSTNYTFNAGLNTVTMTVTDATMATDDSTFTVFVYGQLPTGAITMSSACMGDTVAISATNTDVNYSFNYVAQGPVSVFNISSANGTAEWTGTGAGTAGIIQYVDSASCSASALISVSVGVTDSASFTVNSSACEGDTVNLMATSPNGTFTGTNVVDGGNGTGWLYAITGTNTVTYTTSGTCSDTQSQDVTVTPSPTADFTFNDSGLTVDFTNNSTNADTYSWSFGDGNSDNTTDPTHTYSTDGGYIACLTASTNAGCTSTVCDTVVVSTVGIESNNLSLIKVYPNPASNVVTINSNSTQLLTIEIVNVIGEIVLSSTVNGKKTIELESLVSGTYFIVINTGEQKEIVKLIKQ